MQYLSNGLHLLETGKMLTLTDTDESSLAPNQLGQYMWWNSTRNRVRQMNNGVIQDVDKRWQIIQGLGKNWGTSSNQSLSNWQNPQNILEAYGYTTWINGGTQQVGNYRNLIAPGQMDLVSGVIEIGQLYNETGSTINSGYNLSVQLVFVEQTTTGQTLLGSVTGYGVYTGPAWSHNSLSQQNYIHRYIIAEQPMPGSITSGKNIGLSIALSGNINKVRRMCQCVIRGRAL